MMINSLLLSSYCPLYLSYKSRLPASFSGASISVARRRARSTRNWGRAREGRRKKRGESSFPLPFLPCVPTTFASRERDVWERSSSVAISAFLTELRRHVNIEQRLKESTGLWKNSFMRFDFFPTLRLPALRPKDDQVTVSRGIKLSFAFGMSALISQEESIEPKKYACSLKGFCRLC